MNDQGGRCRVLAVDDEPVARQKMAIQLRASGANVTIAGSAGEAREILEGEGAGAFDCLVTDFSMPGETGIDLIQWLKALDDTLASIVVSAAADKNAVAQMLRDGASDFLEKPVVREQLQNAVRGAASSTRRRRREAITQAAAKEMGLVQRRMNELQVGGSLPAPVTICYHPRHEAGGDSIAVFPLDSHRMLVVATDVSGHDLKSAFISAYFQGALRGMVKQNVPIGEILDDFNSFLIEEWSKPLTEEREVLPAVTSLAVCSALVDVADGEVSLLNGGFPLPVRIDRNGLPSICGEESGYPSGWFDSNPLSEVSFTAQDGDELLLWTDGLEDFANKLQVGVWSLAYRLLEAKKTGAIVEGLTEAPDDILVVKIGLSKDAGELAFFPLLSEVYGRSCTEEGIEEWQEQWQRSLRFALPDLEPQCMPRILLCVREAVLHCLRATGDLCRLTIGVDGVQKQLRVDVDESAGSMPRVIFLGLNSDVSIA